MMSRYQPSRKRWMLYALATIVVICLGAWVYLIIEWTQSVKPSGDTLAEVSSKKTNITKYVILKQGDKDFLALFCSIQSFPRFPSGHPVYIFDDDGRLVDWTADEGDDAIFVNRWPEIYKGKVVTSVVLTQWKDGKQ